jgi:hypothetical protein
MLIEYVGGIVKKDNENGGRRFLKKDTRAMAGIFRRRILRGRTWRLGSGGDVEG